MRGYFYTANVMITILFNTKQVHSRVDASNTLGKSPIRILTHDNNRPSFSLSQSLLFIIGIVGGRVQLGPFGTASTFRPIVPTPDEYDDGEIGGIMFSWGNRSTRRRPTPVPLCASQTPHAARTRFT
jgi:hypothetical protein